MRRTRGEGVQQPVIDELRSGIRVASLTHPASLPGRGFPLRWRVSSPFEGIAPLSGTGAYDPAIPCLRSSPSFSPRLRRATPPRPLLRLCSHLYNSLATPPTPV